MQIANEILRQLGGQRQLKIMVGAKNYVALADGNQPVNGVQFDFMKAKDGINKVQIRLNGNDYYDVKFFAARGINCREVVARVDVAVDQLEAMFWDDAGLAIRLPVIRRA